MEFILSTNVEELGLTPISFNYAEIKHEVESKLKYYNSLIITEHTIIKGKEERAKLNKLKDAIDDKRKDVEREFNKPLETFKTQCKELVGMIDEASKSIDKQVKSFEEIEKETKRAEIAEIFNQHVGDMEGLVTLDSIFDSRWLNKTATIKAVEKEVKDKLFKIDNDVKIIRLFDSPPEIKTELVNGYLNHFNMSTVMQNKALFEERHRRFAELEAKKQELAAKNTLQTPAKPQQEAQEAPQPQEQTKDTSVYFIATTEAFRADMRALCEKHGIKYRKVKQEDIQNG